MVTQNQHGIVSAITALVGSAAGLFLLLLFVLAILTPLMIFWIHRSTSRTADAAEMINRNIERLINLENNKKEIPGDKNPPEQIQRPEGFGEPVDTGDGEFVRLPGRNHI